MSTIRPAILAGCKIVGHNLFYKVQAAACGLAGLCFFFCHRCRVLVDVIVVVVVCDAE